MTITTVMAHIEDDSVHEMIRVDSVIGKPALAIGRELTVFFRDFEQLREFIERVSAGLRRHTS